MLVQLSRMTSSSSSSSSSGTPAGRTCGLEARLQLGAFDKDEAATRAHGAPASCPPQTFQSM